MTEREAILELAEVCAALCDYLMDMTGREDAALWAERFRTCLEVHRSLSGPSGP